MISATPPRSPRPATLSQELRRPLLAPSTRMFPSVTTKSGTTDHLVRSVSHGWNELVDEMFYNVDESDKAAINKRIETQEQVTEGSIVYVSPRKADAPRYFADVVEFLKSSYAANVGAISVPGVGSSVLGAVGLARDVANARNLPVAAIVSGYGLSEVLYDAWGGAIFFRGMNQLEFMLEHMQRGLANAVAFFDLMPTIETYDSVGGGPALSSVKALLRDGRLPKLELLVGHSKGNLLLSGALGELVFEKAQIDRLNAVRIVLLSAISALPEIGQEQLQIIGDLDWLGWANSRLTIPYKPVEGAMHHLNRKLAFHLDAVSELAMI